MNRIACCRRPPPEDRGGRDDRTMGSGIGSYDEADDTFCGSYIDIDEMLYGKNRDANYGYWDFNEYIDAHVCDNDRVGSMV